ncbi:DoxX-like family protein [Microbulbifer harenosus]|uniref:NAD-dependent dehydratase n=1 Tax=Microbulbifer harenosus TaxID=2576840 RepID=A0ABY2UKH4_9GAMM|nr:MULTISPECIES: DoxX-like family protein [Microbulbifer]QIL89070.1 NAD-dependent dehydratase [Microbulbifer sp. SH-1]TLM77804.1 NAD-dependent dehydratase [Microbulbifer harenosus]
MHSNNYFSARLSLSFLWLATALTSAFFARNIGYEVLAHGGIHGSLASICIWSGSALDFLIGAWLLSGRQLKLCYLIQIAVIVTYTLLLTLIKPDFWLHPFGPLTKNIPLLVMIFYLYQNDSHYLNDGQPK